MKDEGIWLEFVYGWALFLIMVLMFTCVFIYGAIIANGIFLKLLFCVSALISLVPAYAIMFVFIPDAWANHKS